MGFALELMEYRDANASWFPQQEYSATSTFAIPNIAVFARFLLETPFASAPTTLSG